MNYTVCNRCSNQEEERKFKRKAEAKKDLGECYRQRDAL